jgi:hypothetical protein
MPLRPRFPRRAVEPFQIADAQGDDQCQRRQYHSQQAGPGEPTAPLDRRLRRVGCGFCGFCFVNVEQVRVVSRLRFIGQVIALGQVVERRLVADFVSVVGHRGVLLLRR